MNTVERHENWKKCNDLIDKGFLHRSNVVRISKANTDTHEIAKFLLCLDLIKNDHEIITECRLKDGNIPDVLDVCHAEIWEILHTEKTDNPNKKTYPLPVRKVNAEEIVRKWKNQR